MATARSSIGALASGAFAVGVDGFVIAGILGDISSDLQVSIGAAGQLETVFALVVAIGAPILMAVLGGRTPRQLLGASMAVFALGNVLAIIAPNFATLMTARVIAALGVALYIPVAMGTAAMLVAPEKRGRALASVTAGMTGGIVVGVPLGIWLCNQFDWRATFSFAALLGGAAWLAVISRIPALASPPPQTVSERTNIVRNKSVAIMLANVVVWMAGGYTLYTFMGPFLQQVTGLQKNTMTLAFFWFGITSVIGSALGGVVTDKWSAQAALWIGIVGGGTGLALTGLFAESSVGVLFALTLWSVAGWMLTPPQQHRLISVSPQHAGVLMSLNGSAIYLGIALGGACGGVIARNDSLQHLPYVGALWEVAALGVLLLSARSSARSRAEQSTFAAPQPGMA